MATLSFTLDSPLAPERVLKAAHDFTPRRADIWPAVSLQRLEVHAQTETSADVTEGTRAGPVVNWERCRYDWGEPGSVTATVTDSNVYANPGSSWQIKATPSNPGSRVEMIWVRAFKPGPRGWLFGTLFRLAGKQIFAKYARDVLNNLEKLERSAGSVSPQG